MADPNVGVVAMTLVNKRVFTLIFKNTKKRTIRQWLAMQLVGGAITLAGDITVEPGDTT